MRLRRRVEAELPVRLVTAAPRAQRSREALQRNHREVTTLSIVQRALDLGTAGFSPKTLLELGAGDGSMMLRLAKKRTGRWPNVQVTLLDRVDLVAPSTLEALRKAGWAPQIVAADVCEWLSAPGDRRWDIVLANLFVHHFAAGELMRLLAGVAARSRVFLCCEPRRAEPPLAGGQRIALPGAAPVTRQDAVPGVDAGFRARELSNLWPDPDNWDLYESSAGSFSHCFLAVRKHPNSDADDNWRAW